VPSQQRRPADARRYALLRFGMNKNELISILTGLLSGIAGGIGAAWLIKKFIGRGIDHFFARALQARDTVGRSDLEFRKLQLSEFYGPMYAYAILGQEVFDLWMSGKLSDINSEIIALFRKHNEEMIKILTTKLYLVEGELPPEVTRFVTVVTLWNIYTARPDQPWFPEHIKALPEAQYPVEFDEYIYKTTKKLKQTIDSLHKKYGIT
jgi:hypothetical protein